MGEGCEAGQGLQDYAHRPLIAPRDTRYWRSYSTLAAYSYSGLERVARNLRAERAQKIRAESFDSALSRFPGRVLLSRDAFGHSTIGAEGLNCRVRDGNGCFTFAMATGNLSHSR